eukprot:m.110056 g.110056  ORF g.110056 m.110056 type:complete len:53 (+) comp28005_c0_seq6:1043-1201(+)
MRSSKTQSKPKSDSQSNPPMPSPGWHAAGPTTQFVPVTVSTLKNKDYDRHGW